MITIKIHGTAAEISKAARTFRIKDAMKRNGRSVLTIASKSTAEETLAAIYAARERKPSAEAMRAAAESLAEESAKLDREAAAIIREAREANEPERAAEAIAKATILLDRSTSLLRAIALLETK